jgi:hypothetical protein
MGGFDEWYQGNDAFLHDGTFNPDGVNSYVCIETITYGTQNEGSGGTYRINNPGNESSLSDRDKRIVKSFFNAVHNRTRSLPMTNTLFEVTDSNDPDRGRRKKAVLTYRMHPNAPLLRQTAYEYEAMNFLQHCLQIRYGSTAEGAIVMDNPAVYDRFNRALRNSIEECDKNVKNFFSARSYAPDAVEVTNPNLGGDPEKGKKKMVKVIYERTGQQQRVCIAAEGDRWPELDRFKQSLGANTFERWEGKPWAFF